MQNNINIFNYLKSYYGINNKKANNIIIYLGLNPNTLYKNIPNNKLITLNKIINFLKNNHSIDIYLKNNIKNNILQKFNSNSITGKKHKLSLPVKGQRTRSNAKNAKKLNKYILFI